MEKFKKMILVVLMVFASLAGTFSVGVLSVSATTGLWLGLNNAGHLRSCDSSGTCVNIGGGENSTMSIAIFDDKLWIEHIGHLKSCDSTGTCVDHGDKGPTIRSMVIFDGNLWLGQNDGYLKSCDSTGTCVDHGDKGDPIWEMAVFDNKLWLGQYDGSTFGSLKSCDSTGTCVDHGNKGPGVWDNSAIWAMAVFDNKLWLGQSIGQFRSCDPTGTCTEHVGQVVGTYIKSMAVFDNKLWLGLGNGHLKSCDSTGTCVDHGNKGKSIHSMVVFDGSLWLAQGWLGLGNGHLKSCDSTGTCIDHGNKGDDIPNMVAGFVAADSTPPTIDYLEAEDSDGDLISKGPDGIAGNADDNTVHDSKTGNVVIDSISSDDSGVIANHKIHFTKDNWAITSTRDCGANFNCSVDICTVYACPLPVGTTIKYKSEATDSDANTGFSVEKSFNVIAAPTVSVTLSANPNSGTAPLNNVDLTATVGGTATGNIRYKFDCTNDGTWESDNTIAGNPYTKVDICDYAAVGNYTAKVEVTREGVTTTDTVGITVSAAPTVSVILSANPNSGTAPLNNVDLTATVGGTATGNIKYRFDCTNDGTWESDNTVAGNPYTKVDICDYAAVGNYTAKVEVTREGVTTTDTVGITVSAANTDPTALITCNPMSCEGYSLNSTSLDNGGLELQNDSTDPEDCAGGIPCAPGFSACAWDVDGNVSANCSDRTIAWIDALSLPVGSCTADLTVTDQDSASDSAPQKNLTFKEDVFADFECSEDGGATWQDCTVINPGVGVAVDFRAVDGNNLSTPSDPVSGTSLTNFDWDFDNSGGAPDDNGATVSLAVGYPAAINYTAVLTITDSDGRRAEKSCNISVGAAPDIVSPTFTTEAKDDNGVLIVDGGTVNVNDTNTITIESNAQDAAGIVDNQKIRYWIDGAPHLPVDEWNFPAAGGLHIVTIPGPLSVGDFVEYQIEATDDSLNTGFDPADGVTKYSFTVVAGPNTNPTIDSTSLTVPSNWCKSSPGATLFSWAFNDAEDGAGNQTAYQIDLTRSDGGTCSSGKQVSGDTAVKAVDIPGCGNFVRYGGEDYDWNITVWDSADASATVPGNSFTIAPLHQYPDVCMTFLPAFPAQFEAVAFDPSCSKTYVGNPAGNAVDGSTYLIWDWDYDDTDPTEPSEDQIFNDLADLAGTVYPPAPPLPPKVFHSFVEERDIMNPYTVDLKVTDSSGYFCWASDQDAEEIVPIVENMPAWNETTP